MNRPVSGGFEKTPGWLDWYDRPSKPRFALPAGSVDARWPIFGNSNIKPIRAKAWELTYRRVIAEYSTFTLTGFS